MVLYNGWLHPTEPGLLFLKAKPGVAFTTDLTGELVLKFANCHILSATVCTNNERVFLNLSCIIIIDVLIVQNNEFPNYPPKIFKYLKEVVAVLFIYFKLGNKLNDT